MLFAIFGKGASNTRNMLAKWNAKAYGEQNAKDLWGQIQEQVNKGWYVPSRAELSAFGGNLGINKSNYESKGLSDWYCSSSQSNIYSTYCVYYGGAAMSSKPVNTLNSVRLGTTF